MQGTAKNVWLHGQSSTLLSFHRWVAPVANKASTGTCGWVCCSHPEGMAWLLVFFLKNTRFFLFFRARVCVFFFFIVFICLCRFADFYIS